MRTWFTIGVAGVVLGCAQVPQMTAADLAGRAERNMIEAQQNLAGRRVIVRGQVKETTLAVRARIVVSGTVVGPAATATATTREEQIPLVVLQPGSVLCYFEPGDIGEAAPLQPGHLVALECEVDYFRLIPPMAVSVLGGCRNSK